MGRRAAAARHKQERQREEEDGSQRVPTGMNVRVLPASTAGIGP